MSSAGGAQKTCRLNVNGTMVLGTGETEEEARENVLKKVKKMLHNSPVIPSGEMLTTSMNSAYLGSGRPTNANMVGRLQELCVSKHWPLPIYNLLDSQGPSHMPHFQMTCSVRDLVAVGNGKTKKEAKHNAAQNLLELLRDGVPEDRGSVPVGRVPRLCAPPMVSSDVAVVCMERRTYQNPSLQAAETFKDYRESSPFCTSPRLAIKEKEERRRSLSTERVSPSITEISESNGEPIPLPSVEDYLCWRFQDQL